MPALKWFIRGFAIDVRSLAVFRMAMAAMVLVCLAERVRDLTDHYTDWGVFPRAARIALDHHPDSPSGPWIWSLHNATGTTWGQAGLFLVAALFATWLLIGYRTRLASVLTWLLTVSIYYRNPLVDDAGDLVQRTVLFWSMFLPLGATASLDRRLSRRAKAAPRELWSLPCVALLLQVCLIYWASAGEKTSPVWAKDHTALYYTLSLDALVTPLGHGLLAFPQLLGWLTVAVYWLEWIAPLIAVSPLGRGWLRLVVVLAFWAFHLGIALTMQLGALPWISIATWCVFLPGVLWDKLGWRLHGEELSTDRPTGSIERLLRHADVPYHPAGKFVSAVVAALSMYIAIWNVLCVARLDDHWSTRWKIPAYVLGLDQTWRMFAPLPLTEDGWYEMRGVLGDGSVVNLWQPAGPLPVRKPTNVAATYRNRRWQKYLIEIRRGWATFLPEFAQWLRRRWDEQQAGNSPQRRLKHIEIIYHIEQTLSPDRRSSLIVPEIVYETDFTGAVNN
jgi:hypothetical protein